MYFTELHLPNNVNVMILILSHEDKVEVSDQLQTNMNHEIFSRHDLREAFRRISRHTDSSLLSSLPQSENR